MSGEVLGAQQVDIDPHRWHVIFRITLEDGTDVYRIVYNPDQSGLVVYESMTEFEAARES